MHCPHPEFQAIIISRVESALASTQLDKDSIFSGGVSVCPPVMIKNTQMRAGCWAQSDHAADPERRL